MQYYEVLYSKSCSWTAIGLYRDVWIAAIASSRKSLATRTAAICVRFHGRRVRHVYVTMQITFLARKSALIYRRGLRQRVASLTIDCNGVFAIRAYWCASSDQTFILNHVNKVKNVQFELFLATYDLQSYNWNTLHAFVMKIIHYMLVAWDYRQYYIFTLHKFLPVGDNTSAEHFRAAQWTMADRKRN